MNDDLKLNGGEFLECHADGFELLVQKMREVKHIDGRDDFFISGNQLLQVAREIREGHHGV